MGLLTLVCAGLGALAIHLLACEIYEKAPSIAKWLLLCASNRLPDYERARYEEEWFAHLNDCEGSFSKIAHALECYICARSLSKVIQSRAARIEFTVTTNADLSRWTLGFGDDAVEVDLPTAALFLGFARKVFAISPHGTSNEARLRDVDQLLRIISDSGVQVGEPDVAKVRQIGLLLERIILAVE